MEPSVSRGQSTFEIADILAGNVLQLDVDLLRNAYCHEALAQFVGKQGTYFVRADSLKTERDLGVDAYGSWGRASSHGKFYYAADQNGTMTRLEQSSVQLKSRLEPPSFDICIKWDRYNNPSSGGELHKTLFCVKDKNGQRVGQLAAVSFSWDRDPFDFELRKHGNSKSYLPYQPTKPSVLDEVRKQVRMKSPAQVQKTMLAATPSTAPSHSTPRNYKQVNNMRQNTMGAMRMGKHGAQAATKYDEVVKLLAGNCGLRDVHACKLGGSQNTDLRCFVATTEQMHFFKRSCLNSNDIQQLNRPLMVDTTYGATDGYLTIFCCKNGYFESRKDGKEPLLIVAFGITMRVFSDSYRYLGEQLAKAADQTDANSVKSWVSDDGKALIAGLQETTLFDRENSTHCLCETHLRENVDRKLQRAFHVLDDRVRKKILTDIFGGEIQQPDGRIRRGALVDMDHEEFELSVVNDFGPTWDAMIDGRHKGDSFSQWFRKKKGNRIMQKYSRTVRQIVTGEADPGRVTNNPTETVNRYVKETALNKHQEPWQKLIPEVAGYAQRTYDQLKQAMYSTGDYKLKDRFRMQFEVSTLVWNRMTVNERQMHLRKMFIDVDLDSASPAADWLLQLGPSDSVYLPTFSTDEVGKILRQANRLGQNVDATVLQNPVNDKAFIVFDESISDGSVTVNSCGDGLYKCRGKCPSYTAFRGKLCEHIIVVSHKRGDLVNFITCLNVHLEKENGATALAKTNDAVNAGKKGGGKRRGSEASTTPTAIVRMAPLQSTIGQTYSAVVKPTDQQHAAILAARPATFTLPCHNEKKFVLYRVNDFFKIGTKRRQCIHCKCEFPKDSAVGDDLLLSHEERYEYPDPDNPGRNKWSIATTHIKPVHARYTCVTARYPYFYGGLVDVTASVSLQLSDSHWRYLYDQLAIFP